MKCHIKELVHVRQHFGHRMDYEKFIAPGINMSSRIMNIPTASALSNLHCVTSAAISLLASSLLSALSTANAQHLAWISQFGSAKADVSRGIAVDSAGNSYVSGYTFGDLGGPIAGNSDAFLAKYDSAGTQLWFRQIGTAGDDDSHGIAIDGLGNVYISGSTSRNLGGPTAGFVDAFLSKYDAGGTLLWSRQLGSADNDMSFGIAVDVQGNAFITGQTLFGSLAAPNEGYTDAFLAKYDPQGTFQWARQIGTLDPEESYAVAVDGAGGAYITGRTEGSLAAPNAGYQDLFLIKYDDEGTLTWSRQIGTSQYDQSYGIAADSTGSVYISGVTDGDLFGPNLGYSDAFLVKYDAMGTLQWARQIGTANGDASFAVAVDAAGNPIVSGFTTGNLGGPNAGSGDAFLMKYSAAGSLQWSRQLGTAEVETPYGIAVDVFGNAYLTGITTGSLGGPNRGSEDAFIAKFVVAEPDSAILLLLACGVAALRRRLR